MGFRWAGRQRVGGMSGSSCEDFHGAVGPIPTERLAVELAALRLGDRLVQHRPVRFALAEQGHSSATSTRPSDG